MRYMRSRVTAKYLGYIYENADRARFEREEGSRNPFPANGFRSISGFIRRLYLHRVLALDSL